MIAGAVGIVGHLEIADDVVVTGQSMVSRSLTRPGSYSSALPVDESRRWRRNSARFRQLDDMARRLRRLERTAGVEGQDPERGDSDDE
jgi:UDP-3-O-[3-hydroxymyristoyl] glucosamine N-acyltransferase